MKGFTVIAILAAAPVFADDVYLKGGGQITGQIIDQTEDSVTVELNPEIDDARFRFPE